uniref:Ribonuclease H2 subunit B n=1 Tax=Timema californicum TaxID=61474 RepID=A0A7R9PBW3_TIMCA|nr:unnamed protein product [Timema californicum]
MKGGTIALSYFLRAFPVSSQSIFLKGGRASPPQLNSVFLSVLHSLSLRNLNNPILILTCVNVRLIRIHQDHPITTPGRPIWVPASPDLQQQHRSLNNFPSFKKSEIEDKRKLLAFNLNLKVNQRCGIGTEGPQRDSLEVPEGFVGGGTPDVVQLRHPQTGAPAMFLFSPGDGMVQEVLTFSENRRSWFIDESVKSDGKMHLSTPIDPIFLVLPYLRKASQVMPLEQILKDEEFPETERLLHAAGLKHLTQVADRRGDDELCAYKYNEEKALSWLQRKAERVAEVLKQKGIAVSSGAMSANFVKSCSKQDADTGGARAVRSNCTALKYAHGMLSEYLPEDLSLKLGQQMSLPEDCHPASSKRKLAVGGNSNNMQGDVKKVRAELDLANGGVLDLTKPEKTLETVTDLAAWTLETVTDLAAWTLETVTDLAAWTLETSTKSVSSKDKARAKVASGSKTISTFFKKK